MGEVREATGKELKVLIHVRHAEERERLAEEATGKELKGNLAAQRLQGRGSPRSNWERIEREKITEELQHVETASGVKF